MPQKTLAEVLDGTYIQADSLTDWKYVLDAYDHDLTPKEIGRILIKVLEAQGIVVARDVQGIVLEKKQ